MCMFKYTNIPFRKEFLEWELLRRGYVCAVKTTEGKVLIGTCSFVGQYDEYGLPEKGCSVDFYTRWGGYQGTYIIGDNAVIGYNNTIRTPLMMIEWYAEEFAKINTAISANVKHSMVSSVPVARNEKIKKALDDLITDIQLGNIKTIAGENILQELQDGTTKTLDILHLTQPEQIERVQYLSKLYDDLLRRFWTRYGHSMNSTGKMAQVNEMELEGYETYSEIIPDDMLEARKSFVEECNTILGTDWTVEYSEPWKHVEEQEVTEDSEDNNNDGKEDEGNGGQNEDLE